MVSVGTKDGRYLLIAAFAGLSLFYALHYMIDGADNPDPQAYKCKHGNAPGVCFKCYLEQLESLPKPTP